MSPNTIDRVKTCVSDLLLTTNKNVNDLNIDDVYKFIEIIQKRKRNNRSRYAYRWEWVYSSKTVEWLVSLNKKFLERCYSYEFINFDPKYIKWPKVTNEEDIEHLEQYEIDLLLRAPREAHDRDDIYYRDTLLFNVGYYMGLRVEESLWLSFDDLNNDVLRIIGKWRKKRFITIPFHIKELSKEFQKIRWWNFTFSQTYERKGIPRTRTYTPIDRDPKAIFTSLSMSTYGKRLRRDALSDIFRFYEKFIWTKKRITYHLLRHGFATFLHNAWVDEETIKQMWWWSHGTTMSKYIHVSHEKMKEAQSKLQIIRINTARI